MKRYLLISLAVLALQAVAPEVEITAEPNHHLTLENKSVRVFNVDVPAHADTLMHWHRHDYVSVNLGPAEIVNAVKDKPPVTVKLEDGDIRFSLATFAHVVRALGDQPFRNVTVEILEDESLRHATSPWDTKQAAQQNEDRALNILHGGTQQVMFVKDAIRVSEFELQSGGSAPMQHQTGPYLLVAVTDLDLRNDVPRQASVAVHMKVGDSKWLPANYSHTITNIGTHPAKFVTLEFP